MIEQNLFTIFEKTVKFDSFRKDLRSFINKRKASKERR